MEAMNDELLKKYNKLKEYLAAFGSVAVAFSSGVDSTFLLYAAKESLGDNAIALTAASCLFPKRELTQSQSFCEKLGVKQFVIEFDELAVSGFSENPPNRCYICKRELFEKMKEVAKQNNMAVVVEGSNLDDNGDYRPGLIAVAELDIKSPLRHIGFTKQEIRNLSEHFGLPTWNKPSFACLASRFPYGEVISREKLGMVEKSEQLLFDMGFKQFRVRIHGDVARIELLSEDFERLLKDDIRKDVYSKFKEYGFSYVALDILGYRTGSLNETLT